MHCYHSNVMPTVTGKTKQIAFRLDLDLVAWLDAEAERLRRETGLDVDRSAVAKKLLNDARRAAGVEPTKAPEPKATKTATPKKADAGELDPAKVHAALLRYLENDGTQKDARNASGIDQGQLSRFKKEGHGLSQVKLAALMKAIGG